MYLKTRVLNYLSVSRVVSRCRSYTLVLFACGEEFLDEPLSP